MYSQHHEPTSPFLTRSVLNQHAFRLFNWGLAGAMSLGTSSLGAIVSPAQAASLTEWNFNPATNHLELTTDAKTTPHYFLMAQPARIVLDLPGTSLGAVKAQESYPGAVRQIRVSQFQNGLTRIVLELSPDVTLAPGQVQLRKVAGSNQDNRWILRPLIAKGPTVPSVASAAPPPLSPPAPAIDPAPPAPTVSVPPLSAPSTSAVSNSAVSNSAASNPSQTAAQAIALPPSTSPQPASGKVAIAVPPLSTPASNPAPAEPERTAAIAVPPPPPASPSPLPERSADASAAPSVPNVSPTQLSIPTPPLPSHPALTLPAQASDTGSVKRPGGALESAPLASASVSVPPPNPATTQAGAAALRTSAVSANSTAVRVPPLSAPATSAYPPALNVPPLPNLASAATTPLVSVPPLQSGGTAAGAASGTAPSVSVPPLQSSTQPAAATVSVPPVSVPPLPPQTGAAAKPSVSVPPLAFPAPTTSTATITPAATIAPAGIPAATQAAAAKPSISVPPLQPAAPVAPVPSTPKPAPIAPTPVAIVEFGQPLPAIPAPQRRKVLLPAGTLLNLRYPGKDSLSLQAGLPQQEVLLLASEVRSATGKLILPADSVVIGRFETTGAGSRFIAQAIALSGGRNAPLVAESDWLTGNPQVSQPSGVPVQPGQIVSVRLLKDLR